MVGEDDYGFHLHREIALRGFLGESEIRLNGLDGRQFRLATHGSDYFRRQGLAFFIRCGGLGTFLFLRASCSGRRRNGDIDFLYRPE